MISVLKCQLHDDKVVAVINLEDVEVHKYTTNDKMLVEILAVHVSLALAELQRMSERPIVKYSMIACPMTVARQSDGLQIEVNDSLLNSSIAEEVIGHKSTDLKVFKDLDRKFYWVT
jgi:hypothetical protein